MAWCSVIFVVRAFELGAVPGDQGSLDTQEAALTDTMWATCLPAGLLGAFVSYTRLKRFTDKGLQRFRWVGGPHMQTAPARPHPGCVHVYISQCMASTSQSQAAFDDMMY